MILIEILQTTMSDYISTETVAQLYEKAGSMTEEDAINIPLDNYSSYLLNDHVHSAIQQVLLENPLPYQLQEFQLATLVNFAKFQQFFVSEIRLGGLKVINGPNLNICRLILE